MTGSRTGGPCSCSCTRPSAACGSPRCHARVARLRGWHWAGMRGGQIFCKIWAAPLLRVMLQVYLVQEGVSRSFSPRRRAVPGTLTRRRGARPGRDRRSAAWRARAEVRTRGGQGSPTSGCNVSLPTRPPSRAPFPGPASPVASACACVLCNFKLYGNLCHAAQVVSLVMLPAVPRARPASLLAVSAPRAVMRPFLDPHVATWTTW